MFILYAPALIVVNSRYRVTHVILSHSPLICACIKGRSSCADISAPCIKGENLLKNLEPCLRDIAIDQCEMTLKARNL